MLCYSQLILTNKMEAQNESTKFFCNKTGDKLYVELEITGNPDDVISKLMHSLSKNKVEIFDGAIVAQILFNGRNADTIVKEMQGKILHGVNESLLKLEQEITGSHVNSETLF